MALADYIKERVDLKSLTTFGVGGLAERYVAVSEPAELVGAVELALANQWPYQIIAGGSNVVFTDAGYSGLLIHYRSSVKESPCQCQGLSLTVEAGLPLMSLINFALDHGLAGLEALSGIPGTVGGAIVGNAGAYGQGISDRLKRIQVYTPHPNPPRRGGHRNTENHFPLSFGEGVRGWGESGTKWLDPDECHFTYRNSIFKQEAGKDLIILRAEFELEAGDSEVLKQKSQEIIATREKKYPPGLKCPGSFFKNVLLKDISRTTLDKIDQSKIIEGKIPAGYLLESVGAKGMKQDRVYIADYHGNLLINDGTATYEDVITLANKLKKLVQDKFGITLEEEVRYIN